MKRMTEILAPAGDFDTLKAAVSAGTDAVYLGGEQFGARAFAKNFTQEELCSAIDYAHLHGRKIYLTVNTLVKEREFDQLYGYLLPYYKQGLDAVIVQDMGVMEYIHRQFPEMDIHASTQMTVTNAISAEWLEKQGVVRVVPARELSLPEIKEIRDRTNLEIECFVHGALCYCYSGQCLLSSLIGGRSGNRGQCAQPCRLPYRVNGKKPADILSLKDLCTIAHIPDLIEHGIDSFKIEGRMKQPAYVAAVTDAYRRYRNEYLEKGRENYRVTREDLNRLMQAYQRRGYCNGYYYVHNGKDMMSLERPKAETRTDTVPDLNCQVKIRGVLKALCGYPAELAVNCGNVEVRVIGAEVQRAEKVPMSRERLEKQMQKTGNTPFVFEYLEIQMNSDIFLPVQALNELRRNALGMLEEKLLESGLREEPGQIDTNMDLVRSMVDSAEKDTPGVVEKNITDAYDREIPEFTVSVETMEQLETAAKFGGFTRIYLEDTLWNRRNADRVKEAMQIARENGTDVYFAMARIYRKEAETYYRKHLNELMEMFDGVLIRNLESLLLVRNSNAEYPVVTDSSIYQWNHVAKDFWRQFGLKTGTAPVELNNWELEELGVQDMELVLYGYLPVMVSAGCARKNTSGCSGESGELILTDRQKKNMTVKNICRYCYNVMYNTSPLLLADQQTNISRLKPRALRLSFTMENRESMNKILRLFRSIYIENIECPIPKMDYTRGHFKRGVK